MITLPTLPGGPGGTRGTRVFVPLVSQRLVAFDWEHGNDLWSIPLAVTSAPVPANGVVYVAAAIAIHALDAATGAAPGGAPSRHAGRAVRLAANAWSRSARGSQRSRRRRARAMEPAARRRRRPVGAAITADSLLATFAKGAVLRVALADGRVMWTHTIGGRAESPPRGERIPYTSAAPTTASTRSTPRTATCAGPGGPAATSSAPPRTRNEGDLLRPRSMRSCAR
jgi:hypothetical protein